MKMSIEQFAESHKSHSYVEHYVEMLRDNHIMNIESFEVETGTGHYAGTITEFAWPCEQMYFIAPALIWGKPLEILIPMTMRLNIFLLDLFRLNMILNESGELIPLFFRSRSL